MDGIFKSWRGKVAMGTLCASLFLMGAWIKSAVDHVVLRGSVLKQPYIVPLSGNIGVFCHENSIEWSGFRPEVKWQLTGLYSDLRMTMSPAQVVPQPVEPALPGEIAIGPVNDEAIVAASHVETAAEVPVSDTLIQTAATSPGAEIKPLESTSVDNAGEPLTSYAVFSDEPYYVSDEPGTILTEWQCCGLRFDRCVNIDSSRETVILIPHWVLIVPLMLITAGLLFAKCRDSAQAGTPAELPPAPAIPGNHATAAKGLLSGWRGKLGIASLVLSLLLTGGWIRSRSIADQWSLLPFPRTLLSVFSAKEGLCVQRVVLEEDYDSCSNFRYRTLTGRRYDQLKVRPLGHELTLPAPPMELAAATVELPSGIPPVTPTADPSSPAPLPPPVTAGVPYTDSVHSDFFDQSLEWGGVYMSHGSCGTSLAIPYGFFVIPLFLWSALLLAWPRLMRVARQIAIGPGRSGRNAIPVSSPVSP
jgi:hypothetical protein